MFLLTNLIGDISYGDGCSQNFVVFPLGMSFLEHVPSGAEQKCVPVFIRHLPTDNHIQFAELLTETHHYGGVNFNAKRSCQKRRTFRCHIASPAVSPLVAKPKPPTAGSIKTQRATHLCDDLLPVEITQARKREYSRKTYIRQRRQRCVEGQLRKAATANPRSRSSPREKSQAPMVGRQRGFRTAGLSDTLMTLNLIAFAFHAVCNHLCLLDYCRIGCGKVDRQIIFATPRDVFPCIRLAVQVN